MLKLWVGLVLTGALLGSAARAQEALTLARDGEALLPIALDSSVATPAERTAAEELQEYLSRISGAEFESVEAASLAPGTPAVYVGVTRFGRAQGVEPAQLGEEESVLKTVGGSLIVSGGRPRGTLYAAYELLDEVLGVRWYTPWAETVPSRATLTVPALDRQFEPYFMNRDMYSHLHDRRMYADHEGWVKWTSRNRMNTRFMPEERGRGISSGRASNHSFTMLVPTEKYFEEHPEYFSERRGERVPTTGLDGNHLCLTNPNVLRIVIEEVRKDLEAYPEALYHSVSIGDGGCTSICDCAACREIAEVEGESGLLLWFVNQVADAIREDYPDKYILTLAYIPTAQPPVRIRARDNVIVYVCTGGRSASVHLPAGWDSAEFATLRKWAEFADHIWVWDYACAIYRGMHFFRPILWQMYDQFQLYRELGTVKGIMQENEFHGLGDVLFRQFYELDMWAFTRLCREPEQPLEALVDDYLEGYYGAAAPALRRYVDLVETRRPRYPYYMFDWDFVREAHAIFEEAEGAVAAEAELSERVRDLRLQLDLATLAWRNDIVRDYLAQGHELAEYPFPVAVMAERLRERMEQTQHPLLRAKVARWRTTEEGERRLDFDPLLEGLRAYVEALATEQEHAPLPERFAAAPRERLIDLTGATFARNSATGPLLFRDEEAAMGLAWSRLTDKELAMPIGVYGHEGHRDVGLINLSKPIRAEEIPGPGYHWYQGPRFTIPEHCIIYLTQSWQFQVPLWAVHDPQKPEQEWEVWISAKFTGPAYPHGEAEEENGFHVDRVVLFPVEE